MRAALIQMTGSDRPDQNSATAAGMIERSVEAGAGFVLTPEVTNCVSTSRSHQMAVLSTEADDPVLSGLRNQAARHGIWILVGSLALKQEEVGGRFVNRSFLISADGGIAARYDKIHMFDVEISERESYRESDGYQAGDRAVIASTPFGTVGLTICYDVRFPHLYRRLAQAGAQIITVPAAFSPSTGAAHWESLLRSRAIENGCYILAPAQTGHHSITTGRLRATHGHSLAVAPWGEILGDGGTEPGLTLVDLDLGEVERARKRVPSLANDRAFEGP